ncbi:MAG: NAD(P)-binding domain-containing protein [Owenweeksia sp.]|nr:NAD(P)-binding domain-containing protein [Owenweeksia sp.]
MNEETENKEAAPYDAIVIGAGICGIVFLKYAHEKKLNCLVLDKQSDVGGLWNQLPAWQDIQNRKTDFAINDVPLNGVRQPAVHEHICAWIDKYQLSPFIKLQTEVNSVSWKEDHWEVYTSEKIYKTRYVIAASGVQNESWIPDVNRQNSSITELHSSAIQKPEELAYKRVTVVGGGASGWDLLDMALGQGAKDIHWVYRNTRWFLPSTRSKQDNPMNDLRVMARAQVLKKDTQGVSAFLRKILKKSIAISNCRILNPMRNLTWTSIKLFRAGL